MVKALSIVIPAYNMEKYLRQTLESCVVNDESIRDMYEVIVVNDGSGDATQLIAEKYAEKYGNTFKVINKENGGYGSVINVGIETAAGKYFRILDGDDWYDKEALEELVRRLPSTDSDVIITDYTRVNERTNKTEICQYSLERNRPLDLGKCSIPPNLLELYGLCYKTTLLKQKKIHISEHCFYTDTEYVLYPLPYVHSIIYFPINLYRYRVGREGQSVSLEGITKHLGDLELVIEKINQYFDAVKEGSNKELIERRIAKTYNYYIGYLLLLPSCKENKMKLKKFIEAMEKKYPERFKYSLNKKIRLLKMSGYLLYRPCCIWHRRME